jgi:glycosyltransferase involved in cell wall biosynthesis
MEGQNTKRPHKVLLVITKSNWGGAQKYTHDLAVSLKERGYDVLVATGGSGEMVHRLREAGVRVHELSKMKNNMNPFSAFFVLGELVALFKKEKPDVVHLSSSKAGLFGALAGKISRVPQIIFTAHGWTFNEERTLWQKIVLRNLALLTVGLSHKTICVSHKLLEQLHPGEILRKKSFVVHNGIAPLSFKPKHSFYENCRVIRKERVAMVSIGELHPSKGFDLALTYLAKLQDISWEWFILGEGHHRQQIERLIKKHDLSSRVHLMGHTKDAAQYLESFDLFFLPSRTEALGIVAIEALQTNLPIVASNVGGIPEVLGRDPGTTLVDMRQQTTGETLRTILSSAPQKITSGRDELRGEFSLERMVEKTIEVYQK